jgi:hypothetical protein
MISVKIRIIFLLIIGIILIICSIIGLIIDDMAFSLKTFTVGALFIIASITLKRWYKE